ncbi:MAG: DUF2788 domain-containing protein [Granulosicoccaceae bacterium]|jgi:hypothetical protein
MDLATFESWSLTIGIGGLILYMLFIIYKLGVESRAGKYGYFVLFFALGLGFVGFVAKTIIVEMMAL